LDAIMVKTYGIAGSFAETLAVLKPSAICIGPNLGLDDIDSAQLFDALSLKVPICLDADALTLIARAPEQWMPCPHAVMTPHAGELRRLIPAAFERTSCRATLARAAAEQFGCCVLFKGPDTVIARPGGECITVRSAPFSHSAWLATAGSGDVLAGFITGLMARGFDAFDAAAVGAHLHLHCAQHIGPGLIAEDLPEALPPVLRACLAADADP
jgi:NAD(P)H-hydrate repair Nnr-like enzyme with NAD(P)H-hydrate dehydratase domain